MMSQRSKRELIESIQGRYLKADRAEKTQILEEFIVATGYHRKYSIRVLKHGPKPKGLTTVERLLKKLKYSLKANVKRLARAEHPDRNPQFEYLKSLKETYMAAGRPVISVDTKKKELISNFKNAGRVWCQKATAVNDHDFDQDGLGKAVPYGIFNLAHNLGYVYVGMSADTPQFAVAMITRWWQMEGSQLYPGQTQLLILADAGGSNGCRPHLWQQQIQEQLADQLGLLFLFRV